MILQCCLCGDEADLPAADIGSRCGRDLSEERGEPYGTTICRGTYDIKEHDARWADWIRRRIVFENPV